MAKLIEFKLSDRSFSLPLYMFQIQCYLLMIYPVSKKPQNGDCTTYLNVFSIFWKLVYKVIFNSLDFLKACFVSKLL